MASIVFKPRLKSSVVAAVAVCTLLAGGVAVATLAGQAPLSDDDFGRFVGLYVAGPIALGGLVMLTLLILGYPRVEIGGGIVAVNGGVWRRTADLRRYGSAHPGYDSVGGQEQAMVYFYTLEHETALRQTGQFEPPSQHQSDLSLPVGGVVGGDRERLAEIADAINAERGAYVAPVHLSADQARDLAKSALRPRMLAVMTVVVLATLSLGYELFSSVDTAVPGMTMLLLAICVATAAITWGVTARNRHFRPFVVLDDLLGGQLWVVSLILILALAGYSWLAGS